MYCLLFFFNDTATTEIYTLSLHDALPISSGMYTRPMSRSRPTSCQKLASCSPVHTSSDRAARSGSQHPNRYRDRKSTRLNSSHANISYAVFCLKKKTPDQTSPRVSTHKLT